MSAAFKNAKKKQTQLELRRFMNEHKGKAKDVKKVDSPLAKYNDLGQLTCILCQSVVRSEAVWNVHINAKQHKENIELAKKIKARTNNFTTPNKRPLSPPLIIEDTSNKKIRGILKNSTSVSRNTTTSNSTSDNKKDNAIVNNNQEVFDAKQNVSISKIVPDNQNNVTVRNENQQDKMEVEESEVLPEGFFDDPKLDAKARNQEYKDPIEEEWERFQKAIKEADNESAAIIAEDQEESTTERQIDEIDEQMKKLSKVLDFEKKKVEVISVTNETKLMDIGEESDDNEDDTDFDEYLDWRSKKSFK